jgi:ornithine carbamoyltransferase
MYFLFLSRGIPTALRGPHTHGFSAMSAGHRGLRSLLDYSSDEISHLLESATSLKKNRLKAETPVMGGRSGALLFEKPSLRTRVSFETALNELGGHAVNLAADMVGMGKRETIADVARNLERWVHVVVFRTFSHSRLEEFANNCDIPVINALTDSFHPCQALAFGLTLREQFGNDVPGSVVFVGDGNNVCSSIMVLCATLGIDFTIACAEGYEPAGAVMNACRDRASASGAVIAVSHSPAEAVHNAAVVYTDVWASMGQENEAARRARDFRGFQINDELLAHAPREAVVSHCLPAHRGEEITDEVLDSPRCVALDEAENRLHVQKAVIRFLLS